MKKIIGIFLLFFCFLSESRAQTERIALDLNYAFRLNAEYFSDTSAIWLFAAEQLSGPTEDRRAFALSAAYEKTFSRHWSLGLRSEFRLQNGENRSGLQFYGLHSGNFRKWQLIQELTFSQNYRKLGDKKFYQQAGLLFSLGREFSFNKLTVKPVILGELRRILGGSLQNGERTADSGRFRFETAFLFGKGNSLAVFYENNTDYFRALAVYDADGQKIRDDRDVNLSIPSLGLRFRKQLFTGPEKPLSRFFYY